jgi:hypothetical protein
MGGQSSVTVDHGKRPKKSAAWPSSRVERHDEILIVYPSARVFTIAVQ